MKRLLSLILCLVMLFSIAVPAYAESPKDDSTPQTEDVVQDEQSTIPDEENELTVLEETEPEIIVETEVPNEEELPVEETETEVIVEAETSDEEVELPVSEEIEPEPIVETQASGKESNTRTFVFVNPIYRNVVKEEDLQYSGSAPIGQNNNTYNATGYVSKSNAATSLRGSMTSRKTNVTLQYYTTTGVGYSDSVALDAIQNEFVNTIYQNAVAHTGNAREGDYLRFQFGGIGGMISFYTESSKNYVTLDLELSYYTTASQESSMNSAVSSLISKLNLSGKNDYQKIKSIYDWITANVTYDYTTLYDDDYKLKYTGYAALVDRTAVCQGYSVLFYRLALEAGVDARVVSSDPMCHAWNVARPVKNQNKYYYLDSTWDAGETSYYYFLRGKQLGKITAVMT